MSESDTHILNVLATFDFGQIGVSSELQIFGVLFIDFRLVPI